MPLSHFGPIPTLIVDLAPYCDLACVMCPQGRGERVDRAVMPEAVIGRVIDGLAAHAPGAHVILPFWNGEPLIAGNFEAFVDRLAAARGRGLKFDSVSIHTNATRLTPELSARIVRSGLFSPLTFSLDAARPETYARIRRGGDFAAVRGNLLAFLDARAAAGTGPFGVFQLIVMEENRSEIGEFVDFWKTALAERGFASGVIFDDTGVNFDRDLIFIRKLIPERETPEELARVETLHQDAKYMVEGAALQTTRQRVADPLESHASFETWIPKARRPCPGIFSHLGVRHDGTVSPCCRDFDCEIRLGNVLDTPLAALWTGARLRDHRLAHVEGRFADVPRCGDCPGQPFGAITDAEVVAWLKSVGEERRIHPYLKRVGAL